MAAFRATSALGRGLRLQKLGDAQGSLIQARSGLDMLRKPYVQRFRPLEASTLISLTQLAEEAAAQLGKPGADLKDLVDALELLKISSPTDHEAHGAMRYLEARLAARQSSDEDKHLRH